MSKLCVVAVFDSAVQAYGRPIFVQTPGVAVRSFRDEVNRSSEDNQLHRHPEDFELRLLCWFDEETGVFGTDDGDIRVLARGKDLKEA